METPTAFMLVTNAGTTGVAIPFSARIGEGTRGNAVRRVDVRDGSADLRHSAERATRLAYDILHREKYLNRQVVVSYEADASLVNVHGRSAELAFAIAFADAIISSMGDGDWHDGGLSVAATGILSDDGAILPVEKLPEKIAAALNVQPRVKMIIFPAGNEGDLPSDMVLQAYAQGTDLFPSFRLEEALRHYGLSISHTWLESPFRGLEPFEFKHASIFFGREKETEEILALLRRQGEKGPAAVLVKGPSGSGKSSLVLAGVIPALLRGGTLDHSVEDIRWGLLRPRAVKSDANQVRERQMLSAALRSAWHHGEAAGLIPRTKETEPGEVLDPVSFLAWLHSQSIKSKKTHYVLVLDQMEEWLQGRLQPQTIQSLFRFLAGLAHNGVWLIATLTNAAYPLLREHSELAVVFGVESQYALEPQQNIASLGAVIREPAKAAGLRFEPGLDTEIFVAASHGGTDILPLLELLLTELYERRDPSHNELRTSDYRSVGGLDGVVSARAEATYASVSAEARETIPQFLWKLATSEEILPSEYPADHPMHELVAAFKARRLLVEVNNGSNDSALHAAHEALFRHWPRAIKHRQANETDIGAWLDLSRESGQWLRGERALIPPGPQLQAAAALVRRKHAVWTASDQPVLTYIARSSQQRSRRQALAYLAIGVPLVGLVAIGAKAGYDLIENRNITRIDFKDVSVPPGKEIAADAYLHHNGISVSARSPEYSRLVIVDSLGLYNGRAVNSKSSGNVLTQQVDDETAPISFTLTFEKPVKSVSLRRAALFPATESGVTHPAWNAHAFDDVGKDIAAVHEQLLSEDKKHDMPARAYVLKSTGNNLIRSVRVTSDYRIGGIPFAGFHAVLISEIDLFH